MSVYGYVRKEYPDTIMNQLNSIQHYSCDELFIEDELFDRDVELSRMYKNLKHGDTVVVADIRAFGKSVRQMEIFFDGFEKQGVRLISVEDGLDTGDKMTSFYAHLSIASKMEHSYHVCQTQRGLSRARENGIRGGRPQIAEETIEQIHYLYGKNKYSLRRIADMCSVSLGTVHKYIKAENSVL